MKRDSKTFKKPREIEMYIHLLGEALEHMGIISISSRLDLLDDPMKRIELEGLLRNHMKYCQKREPECPCQLITATLRNKIKAYRKLN